MRRRWWTSAGAAGATGTLLALVLVACGSSNTVGTTGATGTTGPLVADLSCSSFTGVSIDSDSNTSGPSTAAEAVVDFVAHDPLARSLRGTTFAPAAPPSSHEPVQSVLGSGTVSPGAMPPSPSDTSPAAGQWFAHRDSDGPVTAALHVVKIGAGWRVDELEQCAAGGSGADDRAATATTGEVTRGPAATGMPVTTPTTSHPTTTYRPPTTTVASSPAGSMRGP
jgi:hypothetical protein